MALREIKKKCIFELPEDDFDSMRILADKEAEGNLSRLLRSIIKQYIREHSKLLEKLLSK